MKLAYGSERQVEVLTDNQVERILFSIQNDEKVSKRNRMIILLLLYTGLRVSELCDIKTKNLDFLTAQLRVFGKGGKVREVPLKSEVVDAIKDYLVERSTNPFADSEYLIIGQRGVFQRDAINTMLEKGNNDYTDHGRPDVLEHTNPHYHANPWINANQHGPATLGLHPETPR